VSTSLVVVIGVPDLRWSDVAAVPALARLEGRSAVGSMADKTVGGSTGCLAGELAVDAGTRTVAPPDEGLADCEDHDVAAVAAENRDDSYGADVTALGAGLQRAEVRRIADGPGAAAMLRGTTPATVGADDDLSPVRDAAAGDGRSVVAYTLDTLVVPGGGSRPQRDGVLADRLGRIAAAVPPHALLLVLGTSDAADGAAHLHVAMARGPGYAAGGALTSGSTGRSGYVQLIDVGPTILAALGLPEPATFDGSPMTAGGSAATAPDLVDADRHAVAALDAAFAVRALLFTAGGLALLLALLSLRRPRARTPARWLARVAVPVPLLSWLAQLLPWWRTSLVWLVVALVGLAAVYAAAVTGLRALGRVGTVGEFVAVPAVTAALLVVDQLTGAGLQVSAPLGDDPLEAGRFAGMGNLAFAVLLTAALVAAAGIAGSRRSTPRLLAAGALLAVAVVVDAAPPLGDDLGGALAAVPAAAVTLLLLAGLRLTVRRVVALLVAGAAVAVVAALGDYARPAADQTHLGRFVGQLLHGGAATTLHRKLDSVLSLQGELPALLALVAVLLRRRWSERARSSLGQVPGLTAAAAGLAVLAVIGSLANDSGVVIAGVVVTLAGSAAVAAAPA
jgi:hypothetical protein